MNEEEKTAIIQNLNLRVGNDINDLKSTLQIQAELTTKRDLLLKNLNAANNEVPQKLAAALEKAELNSSHIDKLKSRSDELKKKVEAFLDKTEPLRTEFDKRFAAINKLEEVLIYLKSFEKIDDLSKQMKQSNDDEQLVLLYSELKSMCIQYQKGHRASYVKEYTHYWHNVLKDKLTKNYEDVLKLLKWPFSAPPENPPAPKEVMVKFNSLTKYLFLIEEPEELVNNNVTTEAWQEKGPCLPVRVLLRPLKKRFQFHFTGSRQTARIDRPEWFLTQTLTWIKNHQGFVRHHVQPIADKLELKHVYAVDEFNTGLIALAAERLHTVLALYHTQSSKGEIVDVDAAFAHAVDETLGFHRELVEITGRDINTVLSVLTKVETFLRWQTVEKKYALAKMDEILESPQWSEGVGSGAGAATGAALWIPRAADWFVTLLRTIEDRYKLLPQPGHRLNFLELQLELVEEWRIRLTQLLSAGLDSLHVDSFLSPDATSHPVTAVINAAHHTMTVLLQWAHSLHYLQLHFYRRQFHNFTQQQHHDEEFSEETTDTDYTESDETPVKKNKEISERALSLMEVELQAKNLALSEMSRRNSLVVELNQYDITMPIANPAVAEPLTGEDEAEEAGVFAEAPALLARLRDSGLASLAEHILLEFKAGLKDYKRQKWHSLVVVEQLALCVSSSLCRPLAALCARLARAAHSLAPPLTARLRAHLADIVDNYIFEEIVLESWFNTGGTMQFTYDVTKNLVPAFAPPNKVATEVYQLPRLLEACKILNLDYDDARRLRACLTKQPAAADEHLDNHKIRFITPTQVLQILNQRTDLSDASSPSSVMELF
ncbi:RAD50-interacting protein 1 [Spodoptera frugiperda]|uniref:RAD50-interacting protein 1 n=1 Tax=Spodoptera frugiperda TaxID=7108 RepID=A0A9R0CXW1_SPOFR|nr:RAD50-interacting protein 1 [Spodoptera frugiperda]